MSRQTEKILSKNLSKEKGTEPVEAGDNVAWRWGKGMAEGEVAEVSESKMTKETKPGVEVTRTGNAENPVVYIERENQGKYPVVKKQSELYKIHGDDDNQ